MDWGEIICAMVAAIATVLASHNIKRTNKMEKTTEERSMLRAKESKLSMDMMYACCVLSKGTAMALKNNHFNSEVDHGIELVDKSTDAYNKFLRETTSDILTHE